MTDNVSITLWATNLSPNLSGPEDWIAGLEAVALEAKQEGSELLIAPEYVSEQWLSYQDKDASPIEQAASMAKASEVIPAGVQAIVNRVGIDIMAGTWPVPNGEGGYNNGAHLFRTGHTAPLIQRKLCLTPAEKDPQGWGIKPSNELQIFDWNGLRCAIITCLDIELPALSAFLAREAPDLDLILCPSMTGKLTGYSRVFGCAKARAIELMVTVAVVGCIGTTSLGPNVSGAAVYLPCEEELGSDGRFAEMGPFPEAPEGDSLGPRLHARDIPVGIVRNLRATQPEVWPGAWTADNMHITSLIKQKD